jgi:CDP-4-dehydro-6-deoxyglucose reductase
MSVADRPPDRVPVKLLSRAALSPAVMLLRLRADDEAALSWMPGQHLELSAEHAPHLTLPYSIASAEHPERKGEFELAVSNEGGRELVSRVAEGARLFVSAPRGKFVWEPLGGSTLLVGIGTGLAPLRAMLQATLRHPSEKPIALLFGARSEPHLLWREELESLSRSHAHFHFAPTLSQPDPSWSGRTGRVQEHLPAVLEKLSDVSIYICGNKAMVSDCVLRLTDHFGIHPTRIRSESH